MRSVLKPVDLYDVARMCAQANRLRPAVAGWHALAPADLRLGSDLASSSFVNRSAVAWYRPGFETRHAMVVVPVRPAMPSPDGSPRGGAGVDQVSRIVASAAGWAARNGVGDVVVAGYHDGAVLAGGAVARLRPEEGVRLTVVAFGAEMPRDFAAEGSAVLEVVRGGRAPASAERPEEYLHDIRALYETGDLADMLRDDETHTVIRLPAAVGR